MPLTDREIKERVVLEGMIDPFELKGLNSMGYDLRLAHEFLVPIIDPEELVIDPFNPPLHQSKEAQDYIIIPPHSFILGRSIEYLKIPKDVIGICLGRSTYSRSAIIPYITPLESGWHGTVTIELSNAHSVPVKVWVNVGITQVVFFQSETTPERDYVTKGGRYQGQTGVTLGRRKSAN